MIKGKKITLVIPCYNEEKGIVETIKQVPKNVDEILVIDNNSKDKTSKVARNAGARVVLEKRKGYGYAIRTGIEEADGEVIVTIDGDATYPVEMVEEMVIYLIKNNLGFLSGCRLPLKNVKAMSRTNVIGTKILNFFTFILFGKRIKDVLSGMWVFKKDCYKKLNLVSFDWNISEEIKIEAMNKCKFEEYHIDHHVRLGETKLMKWRVGFENLIFLFWKRIFPKRSLLRILKLSK